MCICSEIESGDIAHDDTFRQQLEHHLSTIYTLLSRSDDLAQAIAFTIRRVRKRKVAKSAHSYPRITGIFQDSFTHCKERRSLFLKCQTNLSAFWELSNGELLPTEASRTLLRDLVYSSLNYLLRADKVEFHQTLIRRFSCIVVFILSVVLRDRYDPLSTAKNFHSAGLHIDYSEEKLVRELIRFRDGGRRYLDIAVRLGGIGALWYLPLEASHTVWEQYLPRTGTDFERAIQHLESIGIVEQSSSFHTISERIILRHLSAFCPDLSVEWYLSESGTPLIQWHSLSQTCTRPVVHALDTRIFVPPPSEPAPQTNQPNPQQVVKTLAQDGLIKIKPNHFSMSGGVDSVLSGFYRDSICAGRTLLKDNAYLRDVLQIARSDEATKYAIFVLAASYYKEFLDEQSAQKEKMKQLEVHCLEKAAVTLRDTAAEGRVSSDAAKMLLIHHAILNPELHQRHWTDYLYQLRDSPGQQTNLIMARHAIWLMAILPLTEKYGFQTFNYDWVGDGTESCLTKVNGIVGASRKMLHFELRITKVAKARAAEASEFPCSENHENLLREITQSPQWVDDTEEEVPKYIALKTAETYRLATQLYCLVRLYRFTPSNRVVKQICARLTHELCELPASGEGYSSLHPAWCFLIACACTEERVEYTKMYTILEYIGNTNKSNVSALCTLVGWMWEWKSGRLITGQWWEDMAEHLDSMMEGKLVCVS